MGQICSNVSRVSPVSHRSMMPRRRSSCTSNSPDPERNPSSQADAFAGSLPCDSDSDRRSAAASGAAAPASSSSLLARPATRPWMSASADLHQRFRPHGQQVGPTERGERGVHAVDPLPHQRPRRRHRATRTRGAGPTEMRASSPATTGSTSAASVLRTLP